MIKILATAVEQLGANARDIGTLISFFKANPNIVGLSKQRTAVMHVSAEDSAELFTEEEAVENAKKFKSDNFSKSLAEMAGKSGLDSELSDKLILSMTDDEIESVMQNEILRALFECERVQKEIEHTIVMMDDDIDFYKKEYVRGC